MTYDNITKSEKFLIAVCSLKNEKRKEITVEDVAVYLWKKYPKEYCLRGYPEYPNADIQKHATKLFNENLIERESGVYGYKITLKGEAHAKRLLSHLKPIQLKAGLVSSEERGYIRKEMERILKTKIFNYYIQNEDMELVESDLFEFMGTSSRSLSLGDKRTFLTRYNVIVKDVIPFCKESEDKYHKEIIGLWEKLSNKFKEILSKR